MKRKLVLILGVLLVVTLIGVTTSFALTHPKMMYHGQAPSQEQIDSFVKSGQTLFCTPVYTETAFRFVGTYTDQNDCFDTLEEVQQRVGEQKGSVERWNRALIERYGAHTTQGR